MDNRINHMAGNKLSTKILVITILIINIGFVVYSATYTVPEYTKQRECTVWLYDNCNVAREANSYCNYIASQNLTNIEWEDYVNRENISILPPALG